MTTTVISAYLEQLELNKNDLTKAILRLAVEWKDLDEHLDPTQKFSDEYEAKKMDLELFQDYLAEQKRELNSVEESLGLRLGELECREAVFRSFQMAQIEEIKTREEQADAHRMWVVQRLEETESRDNMLIEKQKSIELLLEKFVIEKQDLAEILKSVGEKLNALSQKEKRCEDVCEELDSREIQIVLLEEKLEAREKVNDLIYKENEMKLQVRSKELDSRETQVALREEQLEAREKANDLRYKENKLKVQVPLRSSSPVADDFQIIQTQPVSQVEPEILVARPLKSALSMQRARTRKLTPRDFADCHSFPIEKAARIKNVCTTFLKKLCRRHGLTRWPYRRIKSLRRQISVKRTSMGACSGEAKNRILAELEPLETELAAILAKLYHS